VAVDEQRIESFIGANTTRGVIAEVIRRAGFGITWVTETRSGLWGFYLRPNRDLRDILGTNREILLWTTDFPQFQARAISQAVEIVAQEQPRLCDDVVFIVSADPKTRQQVAEAASMSHTHFVGLSVSQFDDFEPQGRKRFLAAVQEQLFTKDLYLLTGAITEPRAFFGRGSLLKELRTTLSTGTTHLALFGLRKTGKTSVLYRLVDEIRGAKHLLHAHLDMQRLDAISPTADYFLWSIGEQLHLGHASVRAVRELRLFGQYAMFSDIPAGRSIAELFDHDIRLILRSSTKNLLLMIDEVELMSPETPGSAWGDAYVRCWRLLRGIDQTNPGRLRFLVAGTNPKCVELNQLNGKENPTYNYFTKRFLGPLSEEESSELVSIVGRRLGLVWSSEALARVGNLTGGHPFLLRAFCSQLHRALSPRSQTTPVSEDVVTASVRPSLEELSSTLSQMVEVLESQYSNEYFLLQHLAAGRIAEFRELAEAFPDDVAHLTGYGLIERDGHSSQIRIELLQSWLQGRQRLRAVTPQIAVDRELAPGTRLDGYLVEAIVGKPGGFGAVYKAQSSSGQTVALKVLVSGSLAKLQREVDALQAIRHPAIVEVLDFGRLSSGQVYLAMTYVDGGTLREYCTRATRLSSEASERILRTLLDALVVLHPDEDKMSALRRKDDLSTEEFRELELARHGYVHRDIKPENVMLAQDGSPVLVDFGISIRASTPVMTMSSTPGYLPPDGTGGLWTPDTDLYQLGLTLLQVSTGLGFDGDNISDLRELASHELEPPLSNILLRLTAATRSERFANAREALKKLEKPKKPPN
jgi:hypothetical protein